MQKRIVTYFVLFLVLVTVLGGNEILAAERVSQIDSPDGISRLIPARQMVSGGAILLNGKANITFTQSITQDNKGLQLDINGDIYSFSGQLDQGLRLKDSISVFKDKDLIKFLGHDKRVTEFNEAQKKLKIIYYLDNQIKAEKEFQYNQNTVDSDVLFLYLQAMLNKGAKNFNGEVILNGRGLKLDMEFKLYTATDFQKFSPEYVFPERFKNLVVNKQKEEAYIFTTRLTGVAKYVYPHKFYYAFKKTPPYNLIAYWGGSPSEPEYYFSTN